MKTRLTPTELVARFLLPGNGTTVVVRTKREATAAAQKLIDQLGEHGYVITDES